MDKFEFCKDAHEQKDAIMKHMMSGEVVTMQDMVAYLVNCEICKDNIMEVQRELVWEPLNAAQRAADGLTEPKFMHQTEYKLDPEKLVKTDVSYKMANKDHHKAVNCMLRYIEKVKHHDPQRYNEFMQSLDEA